MAQNEAALQQACVTWFRYQYPFLSKLLIAVPNGGSRNIIEAKNLKKQGVVAGVADLLLLVPSKDYGSLGIEMKFGKGRQSENQKNWEKEFKKQGNCYTVCRNLDEFMLTIKTYLNGCNR